MKILMVLFLATLPLSAMFDLNKCKIDESCNELDSTCLKTITDGIKCLFEDYPGVVIESLKGKKIENPKARAYDRADEDQRKIFFNELVNKGLSKFLMRIQFKQKPSQQQATTYKLKNYNEEWQKVSKNNDLLAMVKVLKEEVEDLQELLSGQVGAASLENVFRRFGDAYADDQNTKIVADLAESANFRAAVNNFQQGTKKNFNKIGGLQENIKNMQDKLFLLATNLDEYKTQDFLEKQKLENKLPPSKRKKVTACSSGVACLVELESRFEKIVTNFYQALDLVGKFGIEQKDLGAVEEINKKLEEKKTNFPSEYDKVEIKKFGTGLGGITWINVEKYTKILSPITISY